METLDAHGTDDATPAPGLYPHRGPVDVWELIAFLRRTYPIPGPEPTNCPADFADPTPAPAPVPVPETDQVSEVVAGDDAVAETQTVSAQPDPAADPAAEQVAIVGAAVSDLATTHVNPFDTPIHEGPLKGHDPAEWAECCVPPWAPLPETGQRPAPAEPTAVTAAEAASDVVSVAVTAQTEAVSDLAEHDEDPFGFFEDPGTDTAPADEDPFGFADEVVDEAPHEASADVPEEAPATGNQPPLAGLTVLVTGEVTGMTRPAANQALDALGAKVASSVGAKTSLVVLGEGAGLSKLSKISTLRIPVMSAADFLALYRKFSAGEPVTTPTGEPLADFEARQAEQAAEAVDRGSLAAWFGDAPDPVEPDDHLPMQRRHLVTMVVVFPLHNGRPMREVRMKCDCGHRWLSDSIHTGMKCPNRFIERPAAPQAAA